MALGLYKRLYEAVKRGDGGIGPCVPPGDRELLRALCRHVEEFEGRLSRATLRITDLEARLDADDMQGVK